MSKKHKKHKNQEGVSEEKTPARGKGQGTLEKRNGVFFARWIVDGRRYSRTTGATTKEDAEKILADFVRPYQAKDKIKRLAYIKAEMEGEQALLDEIERNKPALKISDALERYYADVNAEKVTEGTKKVYADKFRRFERFIASRKRQKIIELRDVTTDVARDFLADLQKDNLSSATYNGYLTFLRTMWRRLRKEARLTSNPWEEYSKHRLNTNKRENLTLDEVRKVLQSTEGDWRTIWIIGYSTSLRVGDCANLKWSSVDLNRNIITLIPEKTRLHKPNAITINIHQDLRKTLLSIRPSDRHGFVVPECAEAYKHKTIYYRLKMILERCGIKTTRKGGNGKTVSNKSFHSLRSLGATIMAEAGVALLDIRAQLNHSSVETTEGYLRMNNGRSVNCTNALPSLMGNAINLKTTIALDSGIAKLIESKKQPNETIEECLTRIITQAEKAETDKATNAVVPIRYPLVPIGNTVSQNPFKVAS